MKGKTPVAVKYDSEDDRVERRARMVLRQSTLEANKSALDGLKEIQASLRAARAKRRSLADSSAEAIAMDVEIANLEASMDQVCATADQAIRSFQALIAGPDKSQEGTTSTEVAEDA